MTSKRCWCILALFAALTGSTQSARPTIEDYEDNMAEESILDSEIASNSYVLPKQIFNDGKPFYLEKNPVSGALDFNTKKTSGLSSPNALDPQSDKDITLNNIRTPNFHDFLNLPVKYTSSKFVYPLVSSSYANLKYQGNNKNFVSNHKNGTAAASTSSSPNNYYSNFKKNENTDYSPIVNKVAPSVLATPATLPTTTERTTTHVLSTTNPTTISTSSSTTTTTTTAAPTVTTQELPTTNKPQFTRPPLKYTTNKYKYSTIRKRPYITMESSEPLITKNYIQTTPPTTETQSSKSPYTPLAFRPLPSISKFSTLEPADVYSNMATSTTVRPPKKDPNDMSLSELFNSLLEDDEESTTINTIETTMSVEENPPGKVIFRPFQSTEQPSRPLHPSESLRPSNSPASERPFYQNSESMRPFNRPDLLRPNQDNLRPFHTSNSVKPTENVTTQEPTQPSESARPTQSPESLMAAKPQEESNKEKVPFFKQEPINKEKVPFFKQEPIKNETTNLSINRQQLNQTNESLNQPQIDEQKFDQGYNQVHTSNQVQRVQAQPVTNQNTVSFSSNQNVASADIQQPNAGPPASDPNTFEFGIGYNVPMQPQGFAMRFTTPTPMMPPRVQITEEQLVLRPEMSGTGVRFPVRDNFDNAPIVTGTYKNDINGHGAPPMALPQNANGLVVFPSNRQQITTTVGSDLPAVSMDTSNLVSFGFEKATPIVEGSVSNTENAANTVKFVNIPLSPSGQPEEVFQVPIQTQMNYPVANGQTGPASPPALPPTQFNQEAGSRPPYNRLHLTPQQKQQLHQHAIQSQKQQKQQQQHQIQQQQQHQVQHLPYAQPSHFHQQSNEAAQLDQDQRPPQERFPNQANQANNPQQQPPRFNPNEAPRKPSSGSVQRPVIGDRLLPNILPQFRPNAKIGYGPNAYHKDGAENVRPKPQFNNLNRRIQPNLQRPLPPQFRRAQPPAGAPQPPPPPPPNSFNSKMAPVQQQNGAEEQNNPNRRYFQVRPNNNERVYNIYPPHPQGPLMLQHPPLNQPLRRFVEGYQPVPRNPAVIEENSIGVESFQQAKTVEIHESHGANTQRWPTTPNDNKADIVPKLEPVVTLQQLQHQKLIKKDGQEQSAHLQYGINNPDAPVAIHSASDKPPVYVVYPVKTSPLNLDAKDEKTVDEAVVVGQRGDQQPIQPPADTNSNPAGNEYQNTPFTVIRQEQKPILNVKPKLKFPYQLQRPSVDHLINIQSPHDQSTDLYDETSYNIGEEPASYSGRVVNHGPAVTADDEYEMNTKMSRNTDRPIAIAYTPTEPNRYHDSTDRFSSANYASSVISEIREGVTHGADQSGVTHLHPHHRRPINEDTDEFGNPSRGEDYKQEFQAPFYPSVNLDKAPDAVRNSWAVVTPPSAAYSAHSQIDRSDNDVEETDRSDKPPKAERPVTISSKLDSASSGLTLTNVEVVSSTEPFNLDKFQPDFQGGFKPIYPQGMKHAASNDSDEEPKSKASNANIEALVYDDLGLDDKEESTTSN